MNIVKCPECQQEKEPIKGQWRSDIIKGKPYLNFNRCLVCFNAYRKTYRVYNTTEQKAYAKEYVKKNKQKIIERRKANYHKVKDGINARRKSKYASDPSLRKKNVERVVNYRKNNINYGLTHTIACSVRKLIKNKDNIRVFDLLGYTVGELKEHLEKQFRPGMTWENHGTVWHIDHKIPSSWYKIESRLDPKIKECWGLDNLQPLFAHENLTKGNRFAS
jgi:hypothetical protein